MLHRANQQGSPPLEKGSSLLGKNLGIPGDHFGLFHNIVEVFHVFRFKETIFSYSMSKKISLEVLYKFSSNRTESKQCVCGQVKDQKMVYRESKNWSER